MNKHICQKGCKAYHAIIRSNNELQEKLTTAEQEIKQLKQEIEQNGI